MRDPLTIPDPPPSKFLGDAQPALKELAAAISRAQRAWNKTQ